jgi:hypothetical protein
MQPSATRVAHAYLNRLATQQVEAGVFGELLWNLIDERAFYQTYSALKKAGDEQSADLARQVVQHLRKALDISQNEEMALSRLSQVVQNHSRWDLSLQRNNIFKAANLLGIRLPSAMF